MIAECSTLNETTGSQPHQRLRDHCVRGGRGSGWLQGNNVFWTEQDSKTDGLPMIVTTHTQDLCKLKPQQIPAQRREVGVKSQRSWGIANKGGAGRGKVRFLWECSPWQADCAPVEDHTTKKRWAAPTGSNESEERGRAQSWVGSEKDWPWGELEEGKCDRSTLYEISKS